MYCNTCVTWPPGTTRNENVPSVLTEEDFDELTAELTRVEDEIETLRQVVVAKEKYALDIRRQLGQTPLNNIKHNLARGWQDVQTSSPYKRTQESLSYAGQMTTAALSTVGLSITRRLAEMRNDLTAVHSR
ncbi:hypothetical protein CRUP_027615 [Coryphaenoides rupestris]|nr:hypothetical protein CRUP_027615 [Coryphaenoides rupestris]